MSIGTEKHIVAFDLEQQFSAPLPRSLNANEVRQVRERICARRAAAGWADLLARQTWHEFSTLTWAKEPCEEQAARAPHYWLQRRIDQELERRELAWRNGRGHWTGPLGRKRRSQRIQARYVLAIEQGARYGRRHVHAIVRWPDILGSTFPPYASGYAEWAKYGRAKLEAPKCQEHVSAYIAKYIAKSGSELVLSRGLDLARLPETPPTSAARGMLGRSGLSAGVGA